MGGLKYTISNNINCEIHKTIDAKGYADGLQKQVMIAMITIRHLIIRENVANTGIISERCNFIDDLFQ